MRHINPIFQTLIILPMVIILAGCGLPAPAAPPTVDVQPSLVSIRTEAAGTAFAEMTLNAPSPTATSTVTPAPTESPTPPPSATPTRTRTPILWTWTPTLPSGGCYVVSQAPDPSSSYLPDAGFDAVWYIKNTSGETWLKDQVRALYASGAVMQTKSDEAKLEGDVGSGSTTSVTVDMQAPSRPGTYVTNWAVYRNEKVQCGLTLTIRVAP